MNSIIYSFKQPIDFKFIFNLISRFLINNRRKVLEKYTISQFRQNLLEYTLEQLVEKQIGALRFEPRLKLGKVALTELSLLIYAL